MMYEEPDRGGVRHEEPEQLQARLVGPVQVVEHEDDRTLLTRLLEQSHRGRTEEVTLGVRVAGLGWRELAQTATEGGHHASQLAAVVGHMGAQLLLVGVGHQVGQGLLEREVRWPQIFVTASQQDAAAPFEGGLREFGR